jgi:hypothetical protein
MVDFLLWLENTWLSTWVREAPTLWAFPFVLFLHTFGLSFVAGVSLVVNLRLLGFASGVPLAPMMRLYPFMWAGFWINAISGLLLLAAYPTKALTNEVFYLKLATIAWAVSNMIWIRSRVLSQAESGITTSRAAIRAIALLTLVLWTVAITAGRFLAYTYNYLTAIDLT